MSAAESRVTELLRAARRQMESGEREQALRTLRKAMDLEPDNDEVREEAQSIEREIAAMKAFKRTRSIRAHSPTEAAAPAAAGFVEECVRRSDEALEAGDEIRALQELERARRQDDENVDINRRIKSVKRSIKANNLADLGLTRLRASDPAGALEQARKIFEFWPTSPALDRLLAEVEDYASSAGEISDEDLVDEFVAADGVGTLEAEEPVEVEETPAGVDGAIAAIRELIAGNEFDLALQEAREAQQRFPDDPTIRGLAERLGKVAAPVSRSAERTPEPVIAAAVPVAAAAPAPAAAEPAAREERERRKLPLVPILVGAAVVAAVAFGAVKLFSGRSPEPVEAPPVQPYSVSLYLAGADDALLSVDGQEIERDSTGAYRLTGTDFGERSIEVRAQGYEVLQTRLDLAQGQQVTDTLVLSPLGTNTADVTFNILMPAGEPTPQPGSVSILVDGVSGTSLSSEMPTGTHVFQAVLTGYNSLPETVLVDTPGSFLQPLALLSSETSQISLTLAGDIEGTASFFVDGTSVGSGRRLTHIADRGTHTLTVRLEGYEDWTRSITLGPDGYSATVTPERNVTTGRLLIGPEPWAEVTIDGQSYGQTPLPPIELEPGTYSVRLTNPGYEDQVSTVTITLGEDTMIRYTAAEVQQQPDIIEEQPVIPPFAISTVAPTVPGLAAERGDIHGYVTLELTVRTDGSVSDVRVVNDPLGLGCGQAAADAVSQWRFQPATQGGVPVEVPTTVQVRFDVQ